MQSITKGIGKEAIQIKVVRFSDFDDRLTRLDEIIHAFTLFQYQDYITSENLEKKLNGFVNLFK